MLVEYTPEVWYGDWQAPFECIGKVAGVIDVAHAMRRRGAHAYYSRLGEMTWETTFVRLALRDKDAVTWRYVDELTRMAESIRTLRPGMPILTHCQMGGHRGPTAALLVAWHFAGRTGNAFARLHDHLMALAPGLKRARPNGYYNSAVALLRPQEAL